MARKKPTESLEIYRERIRRSLAPVVPPENVEDEDLLRGFTALGLVEKDADNPR